MQKNPRTAAKQKPALVYKAFPDRAPRQRPCCQEGVRVFVYLLLFALVYLFIGQALMFDNIVLRVLLNLMALLGFAARSLNEGGKAGLDDVAFAEIALQRQQSGKEVTKEELNRCFHPLKGFFTAIVGVLPLLLVAILFAFMAREVVYQLGALPGWLQGFERRADVGQALAYYHEPASFELEDALRVIVRLALFPFVNMVGAGSSKAMLTLERLSPLLICILPLGYAIGYTQGKRFRAGVHGAIVSDTKRRVQRERRERRRRRRPGSW